MSWQIPDKEHVDMKITCFFIKENIKCFVIYLAAAAKRVSHS